MNCKDCKFGRRPGMTDFENKCYRYPGAEFTAAGDWCGEWKEINEKPILRLPRKEK